LKFVSSDVVDAQHQLRGEAQRASRLNHPSVCTIHEVGASDGMTYFVMEHVSGQTLGALIAEHPLPLDDLLKYGSQIAEALAHAHARGLIHRDLKSSNVMVTPEGLVKVLDFGLACPAPPQRVSEVSQSRGELSREEPIAGTLPYMAPELLRAQPADARSDVWALGVVLYEMAMGRLPFEGKTGFELSAAILHLPTPTLSDQLPLSLQGIIRRSLAKNAGERYAHAGAAAAAIDAVGMEFAAGRSDQNRRPRTSPAVRTSGNLPVTRTSFVGRADELAKLARELESNKLVTLTGVGGSGKTRLALRIAEQLRSDFPDGVWWVDLAPLGDDRRVEEAVASTFGILNSQRPPREALLEYLVERRLLLVLDNCEHLLSAIADLADAILATSEGVHVLATSREGLGVTGERILAVPSLSIPRGDAATDLAAIADSDAVHPFASRAAAVQPGFSITRANASIVLDICRRLDGIPLAIELAAARARLLSVEQIRSRLEDRLALLSGRGRAIPRHQTLGTALQWSYDLLTPAERRTLRFLSAFHGLWTLSAAAAVCGQYVEGQELLDLVWRLVEKSLVEVVHTEGVEAHYRLLEMVRQFANDHLISASEATDARTRHAEYYLGRFERAGADLVGPREVDTVAALDLELDNLLAALHYSSTSDEGTERVLRRVSTISRSRSTIAASPSSRCISLSRCSRICWVIRRRSNPAPTSFSYRATSSASVITPRASPKT
jgi:non-specific serine/threonine protein kinase